MSRRRNRVNPSRRPGLRIGTAVAVHILCVIALTLSAFAHRVVLPSDYPAIDLSAYELPDGTLPVLCLHDLGAVEPGNADQSTGCEYCRLADSVLLSEPSPDTVRARPGVPAGPEVAVDVQRDRLAFPPNAPPTGPPRLVT